MNIELKQGARSFYFDQIFPTLSDWRKWYNQEFPNSPVSDMQYKWLFSRFSKSQIAYDTVEAFLNEFYLTFSEWNDAYMKEREYIQNIYGLTTDDVQIVNTAINNIAQNPNTKPLSAKELLSAISSQTQSFSMVGKLQAYVEFITNITGTRLNEFLARFNHLFLRYVPSGGEFYNGD